MERIGLIAGAGRFPVIFAEQARNNNTPVYAIGIDGITDRSLARLVDKMEWVKIGDIFRIFDLLKSSGIKKAVMAGKVTQEVFFKKDIKFDAPLLSLVAKLADKKTDTILNAAKNKLQQIGIELLDSRTFLCDYMAKKGVLTKRPPDKNQMLDIDFGKDIAKKLGLCDVGQTVVVKDKVILAVEALEGTDETIRRGGKLAGEGAVVVKMAKPKQDMRFDIPVVGPSTIASLKESRSAVIAVEAGKTLLIDKEIFLKDADANNISVIAI